MAFELADKQFGVTQILDAADMDVAEPDERCVMTYLSMLYDILPRSPSAADSVRDLLSDNERLMRVDEYLRIAQALAKWLARACDVMQERAFPTSVNQLNSVRLQLTRFRDEDAQVRERDKLRLIRLFDDLVVSPFHYLFSLLLAFPIGCYGNALCVTLLKANVNEVEISIAEIGILAVLIY